MKRKARFPGDSGPVVSRPVSPDAELPVSNEQLRTINLMKKTFVCEQRRHDVGLSREVNYRDLRAWSSSMTVKKPEAEEYNTYQYERKIGERRRKSKKSKSRTLSAADKYWATLAAKVIRKKVDPVNYIKAQFYDLTLLGKNFDHPQQMGYNGFSKYEHMLEDYTSRCRYDYKTDLHRFVEETRRHVAYGDDVSETQAAVTALCDDSNELGPLFRYCCANQLKKQSRDFQMIMRLYRVSAALEFCRLPAAWLEVCGKGWLTPGIIRRSHEIYDALYEGRYGE